MLAFADQVDRATEFTQKQLDYAANVSFPAYSLVYLFSAILFLILVHILCFVRPNAKSQRECNAKTADAVERLSMSSVVTTQLLEQHEAWHRSHDSRLSRWEQEQLLRKCPLLDQKVAANVSPMLSPEPPRVTPIPHGV